MIYVPTAKQIRVSQLHRWRKIQQDYMLMRMEQEDWHGVQDAASDLRDLDERIAGLEEAEKL